MDPHVILALVHLVAIVPFLLYVGLVREQIPESVFNVVLALGVILLFYQSFKAYTKIMEGKSPWINYIHIFLLAPILITIDYYGKNTSRKYFEMLLMFAFAAGGYHSLTTLQWIGVKNL